MKYWEHILAFEPVVNTSDGKQHTSFLSGIRFPVVTCFSVGCGTTLYILHMCHAQLTMADILTFQLLRRKLIAANHKRSRSIAESYTNRNARSKQLKMPAACYKFHSPALRAKLAVQVM